jgi:hypothetical protein
MGVIPSSDNLDILLGVRVRSAQREIVGNRSDKLLGSSNLKLQGCKMQQDPNESR